MGKQQCRRDNDNDPPELGDPRKHPVRRIMAPNGRVHSLSLRGRLGRDKIYMARRSINKDSFLEI